MKLLRKTRKDLFKNNRIVRYLIYSIGEIILIVAGILIALYLDNQNELQKQDTRLKKVIEVVKSDLRNDLKELNEIIPKYEEHNKLLRQVIQTKYSSSFIDSINQNNLDECTVCFPLHTTFNRFSPKNDGYLMLKTMSEPCSDKLNELNHEILIFYNSSTTGLALTEKILAEMAINNLYDLEKHEWYLPCIRGEYNRDVLDYLLTSTEYKNKLASFQIVSIGNFLELLKEFKQNGEILLKKINASY